MDPIRLSPGDHRGSRDGGFQVDITYPGIAVSRSDSGIGAIGRIDRARIQPGVVIRMHHHKDDEILTYIRSGRLMHLDTIGNQEQLSQTRLMMMNAGHTFQHEEHVLAPDVHEALQIFLRPHTADLEPMVQFHDFDNPFSVDQWRPVAGPANAPLVVRAQAWVDDLRLTKGTSLSLPSHAAGIRLLFVFAGSVIVDDITLEAGDRLLLDSRDTSVTAHIESDLVLISTDPDAAVFKGGMFSGNVLV